jgi:glycine hydroxymethyltransferase
MGVFDVTGPHAAYFLNVVTTNDARASRPGESQYSFLLAPDGSVIDDLMVYRLTPSRFLLIVNAANTERDWAWLNAVNDQCVCIDDARPWVWGTFSAELRDLHDPRESYAWQVDLALQGPRSRDVLLSVLDAAPASSATREIRARLLNLGRGDLIEAHIPNAAAPGGVFDLFIASTGYTGERMGFEILVHPDVLETLWETLLDVGAPFGLTAVGLGARDSLRIEAGLPLYGHELAGPLDLRPDEAGYGGFVKLHKPFFIGRRAFIEHSEKARLAIARFRVAEKGVRVPKPRDVVTESRGRVIGEVTSCGLDTEGYLVGMAAVDRRHAEEGTELNIFPHPTREAWDKPYDELELGDRLVVHAEAKVIPRFRKR